MTCQLQVIYIYDLYHYIWGRGAAGGQGRLEKIGLVEVEAVVEVGRLCWLIRITLVTGGGAQAGGR